MLRALLPVLLALSVLFASLAPVMADPVEPLGEHAKEKADEAGDDPVGFAKDHASEESLAQEIRWTREYGCFAAREAAKEAGEDPPDLSALGCPGFEEVREEDDLGLDDPDEAAADSLDEVDGVVSDALGTVDDVAKDPKNAAQAVLGFLQRSLDAVGRIVDGIVGGVKTLVKDLVGLPVKSTMWSVEQAAALQASSYQLVMTGAAAVGEAVKSTGDALTDAVGSVGDSIRQTVEGWFSSTPEAPEDDPLERPSRELEETTDDLLPELGDALPEL